MTEVAVLDDAQTQIGHVYILDPDDGTVKKCNILYEGMLNGIPTYSIEHYAYGLSESELWEELTGNEFVMTMGSVCYEAVKCENEIHLCVKADYGCKPTSDL